MAFLLALQLLIGGEDVESYVLKHGSEIRVMAENQEYVYIQPVIGEAWYDEK